MPPIKTLERTRQLNSWEDGGEGCGRGPRPARADGGCVPVDIEKGPWRPSGNGNALHERNGLSSHGLHRSTFGDGELNCRVRHGTG